VALNQFELAEAYAKLTVRDGEFNRAIGRTEMSLKRLQGTLDAAARKAQMFLLAGAAAIAGVMKVTSDAEETMSKFRIVFKGQADEALEWAKKLGENVKRSHFDIIGFMARFQDTFVPMGIAREEATKLSKTMTKLTIDLASFNNENEAETASLLTAALTGTHDAVRRYGIVLSASTLNQELMNMGIAKGIRGATELQKTQARLNLMLSMTADAQGDAARTSDSLANQWKDMISDVKKLAIQFGQQMLPAIIAIIEDVKKLIDWLSSLSDETKKLIGEWGLWAVKAALVVTVLAKVTSGVISLTAMIKKLAVATGMLNAASMLGGGLAGIVGGGGAKVFRGRAAGAAMAGAPLVASRIGGLASRGGGLAKMFGFTGLAAGSGGLLGMLGLGGLAGAIGAGIIGEGIMHPLRGQKARKDKALDEEIMKKNEETMRHAKRVWIDINDNHQRNLDIFARAGERGRKAAEAGSKSSAAHQLGLLQEWKKSQAAALENAQAFETAAKEAGHLGEKGSPAVKAFTEQVEAIDKAIAKLTASIAEAAVEEAALAAKKAEQIAQLNDMRRETTRTQASVAGRFHERERKLMDAIRNPGRGVTFRDTGFAFGASFQQAVGSQITGAMEQQLEVQRSSLEELKGIHQELAEVHELNWGA